MDASRGRRRTSRRAHPETLWQLVEKQVENLAADEQAVLVAASVAGVEFSAAVVMAAGIEPRRAIYGARRWRDVVSSFGGLASRVARRDGGRAVCVHPCPVPAGALSDASPSANG